ncbi:MAG: TRAP transporter small permease subunit [Gammaproteobacteria bacterium]|jgi:TRAP-type mannitol/chloroaromatic compound transport system permease small subunit|nr:MAG: hypothetical protein AMJ59_17515 [Gammaproteobacteria bacterium SG8_31]
MNSGSMERLAQATDRFVCLVGRAVSWLCLVMVLVAGVVVALRYFFGIGWIWLQETVTWMHGAVFMMAAAYTLSLDEHVRVDVIYRKISARKQAIVDTLGVLLLLLPTCGWILWSAWDYVISSWQFREASLETGGLPGLFLLKSLIVLAPLLLAVEGVALVILRWARLGRESGGTG